MLGDVVGQRAEPPRAGARAAARSRPARCSSSASASASIPRTGCTDETDSTGAPSPSAFRAARRSRTARSAIVPRSALVTTSTSGTSMIPALRNWSTSPEPGCTTTATVSAASATSVSDSPDADGLDHDDVECRGERLSGGARGRCEPAEPLARGHRADEQAAVGRIGLDPRTVAEQRAARALGGGVDGEHPDRAPALAPDAHERAQQRRLAGAGRTGHADDVRGRLAAQPRRGDLGEQRGDLLAPLRRAVLEQVERGRRRAQVARAQPRAELRAAHAAAAIPLRSATIPTTSRRMRVSS